MKYTIKRKVAGTTAKNKPRYGFLCVDESGAEGWINAMQTGVTDGFKEGQTIDIKTKQLGNSLWMELPKQENGNYKKELGAQKEPGDLVGYEVAKRLQDMEVKLNKILEIVSKEPF